MYSFLIYFSVFVVTFLTFIRKTFYPDNVIIKNNIAHIKYRYKGKIGTYRIPMGEHCKFDYEEFPITLICNGNESSKSYDIDTHFPLYPINIEENDNLEYVVGDNRIICNNEEFKEFVHNKREEELASLEELQNIDHNVKEEIQVTLDKIINLLHSENDDKEKMVLNILLELKNII